MKSSKELIFCVVVIISATISFITLSMAITKYWLILPCLIMLPLCWAVYITVTKNHLIASLTAIIATLTFFMIFSFKIMYLIPVAFLIISLIFGYTTSLGLRNNLLKQSVSYIASAPLSYLMYGIVTLASFVAFYSAPVQNLKNGIRIPPKYIEIIANNSIPGYSSTTTVDDMINSALKVPAGQSVDGAQRDAILEQLGLDKYNLKGNDTLSKQPQALSDLFSTKINDALKNFGSLIPLTVASTLWTVLIVIAKMLVPIILILDALIMKLLIRIGLVTTTTTTVEREELGF